jgi:hypothetical protein
MKECIIEDCVRDTLDDFCSKHLEAKHNLEKTFPDWQKAYGKKFTMKKYLQRLAEDDEIGTGEWVVSVAKYLLASNL